MQAIGVVYLFDEGADAGAGVCEAGVGSAMAKLVRHGYESANQTKRNEIHGS